MNLFADEHTDRIVFGWEMPATWLQSINSAVHHPARAGRGHALAASAARSPSTPVKFGSGLFLLGVGFVVMAWGAQPSTPASVGHAHRGWSCTYFFHTVGELCLIPGGTVERDEALAGASRRPDDGHLVHGLGARQPDRRGSPPGARGEPPERDLPECGTVLRRRRRRVLILSPWMKKLAGGTVDHAKLYPAHVAARQKPGRGGPGGPRLRRAPALERLALHLLRRRHARAAPRERRTSPRGCRSRGRTICCSFARALRPKLLRFAPEDFWYEQAPLGNPFWLSAFELEEVAASGRWERVAAEGRVAYVGDAPEKALERGIDRAATNPPALVARLDWDRSYKTPYEVACIEEAERVAARGHRAARRPSTREPPSSRSTTPTSPRWGASTRTCRTSDHRARREGRDAALPRQAQDARRQGALDRLGARATGLRLGHDAHLDAARLRPGVPRPRQGRRQLQQELCAMGKPGLPYPDIHRQATCGSPTSCTSTRSCSSAARRPSTAGSTHPFFPHGVGHFLGSRCTTSPATRRKRRRRHQAARRRTIPTCARRARSRSPAAASRSSPASTSSPMLLREHRSGARAELFDWPLVDRLKPCGGIRIEDNLLVTADGHKNLTRPHISRVQGPAVASGTALTGAARARRRVRSFSTFPVLSVVAGSKSSTPAPRSPTGGARRRAARSGTHPRSSRTFGGPQPDPQAALYHQEELVLALVVVPDELALSLTTLTYFSLTSPDDPSGSSARRSSRRRAPGRPRWVGRGSTGR